MRKGKSKMDTEQKICRVCKKSEPEINFAKHKRICKICHKAEMVIYQRGHYLKNRENVKDRSAEWYKNNKDRKFEKAKEWIKNNPDKNKKIVKKWRRKNKETLKAKAREWRKKYFAKRIKTDPIFKTIFNLRNGTRRALKYGHKPKKTLELLGCTVKYFASYIENKFEPGMNWENWSNGEGNWNLDHIKPISSFDFSKPESWSECFHYMNMQPMWWRENIFIKGDKTDYYRSYEEDNFDPLISKLDINLNDSPD